MHASVIDSLLSAGERAVINAVMFGIIALPALLKGRDRLVKNIGIIATILAILAQFLPPVLDLLSIPITKP